MLKFLEIPGFKSQLWIYIKLLKTLESLLILKNLRPAAEGEFKV